MFSAKRELWSRLRYPQPWPVSSLCRRWHRPETRGTALSRRRLSGLVTPYVIYDPKPVDHPQRVADVLKRDGDLDRLGLKPTTGPSVKPSVKPHAAWGAATPFPANASPADAKPADLYQYISNIDECAANDSSSNDGGWIKNRYSYCQRHLTVVPAIKCGLWPQGCYLRGWLLYPMEADAASGVRVLTQGKPL